VKLKLKHKLEPIRLNERNWFYLNERSITLMHEVTTNGKWIQTDEIIIPLRKLENLLVKP